LVYCREIDIPSREKEHERVESFAKEDCFYFFVSTEEMWHSYIYF